MGTEHFDFTDIAESRLLLKALRTLGQLTLDGHLRHWSLEIETDPVRMVQLIASTAYMKKTVSSARDGDMEVWQLGENFREASHVPSIVIELVVELEKELATQRGQKGSTRL